MKVRLLIQDWSYKELRMEPVMVGPQAVHIWPAELEIPDGYVEVFATKEGIDLGPYDEDSNAEQPVT